MTDELPTVECWRCHHRSIKRVVNPQRCPNCGAKYNHALITIEEPLEAHT